MHFPVINATLRLVRSRSSKAAQGSGGAWRALFSTRPQTPGEELANALSGALGVIGALAGSLFLLPAALSSPNHRSWAGAAVFLLCLLLLHLASTLYHAAPAGWKHKKSLRVFDHSAILLLIAGTYTPFAAGPLWTAGGLWLLILQWSLAAAGILLLTCAPRLFYRCSLPLYLIMGWSGVFFLPSLTATLPVTALAWIVAGGIAYTLGVLFYALQQPRFCHSIWHLFVLAGGALHFWAVLQYTL